MSNNIIARPHYSIENENQYRRAIESELAKRPQLLGPNVYQGKQGGAFYDAGGAAFNPRHPKYDCKADGSTDDYARLNACFVDARAAGLPVDMGDFPYLIGTALNIADVPILGNPTIIPSGFTAEPIYADGSIGSFHNLDSDATIGFNRIECAALALLVTGGDILKISSDADFSTAEVGIKQGELKSVRNVVGDFIYFNETLLDTYTTANGAKAALVTLANVDVRGKLTIIHTPAANDTNARGVRFKYCKVRGYFDLYKCRGNGATFDNCWRPEVRVDTSDAVRTGSSITAYGIAIQNCTMYGTFVGVLSGVRSAVNGSGVNSEPDGGPSWENHVTAIGHGGSATAIFGVHSNVGSIYFEHCTAIGGTDVYDLAEVLQNDPVGFSSGARRTYIRDCAAIRTGTAAGVRGETPVGSTREEFIVDGLHVVDCSGNVFNKGGDTPTIEKLVVRNLTGNITDKETAALSILIGGIDEWVFEGIHVTGGKLLSLAANLADVPDEITVNGFTCRGPSSTEADSDVRGVFLGATNAVNRIRLRNGEFWGMYWGVRLEDDLDLLELTNVDMQHSLQHVLINTNITVGHLKWRGGSARGARHADASAGVVSMAGGAAVTLLEIDGVEVDTDPYFVAGTAQVTNSIIGAMKTHASFTDFVRSPGASYLEVLSGSLDEPRVLRGSQDPEGAITASVGTKYFRTSGLEYFKESGTGNTGWKTTLSGSATWNPPSLNTATQQTTTVTVTGAALGDHVESVSFSLDLQGTILNGYVSAADTVTVVHRNDTGGTLDIANGTLRVRVKEA